MHNKYKQLKQEISQEEQFVTQPSSFHMCFQNCIQYNYFGAVIIQKKYIKNTKM